MGKHKTTAVLFALIAAFIFGLAASPSVHIAYHCWQLDRLSGMADNAARTSYQGHCDRLVDLGHFFHKSYDLEHLEGVEGSHPALFALAPRTNGLVTQAASGGPLVVYDLADNKKMWDDFVAGINTPSFSDDHAGLLKRYRAEFKKVNKRQEDL